MRKSKNKKIINLYIIKYRINISDRPWVLITLMVAQKIWDEKFLSNSDFSTIYPFFDNKQLNTLEMKFFKFMNKKK